MINKAVELYRKYKEIINYLIVGGCIALFAAHRWGAHKEFEQLHGLGYVFIAKLHKVV